MTEGMAIAAAARALVGAPFRLHGRDPATGLDCVGLVAAAFRDAGITAHPPVGYRLRNRDITAHLAMAARIGLFSVTGEHRPGDVVLAVPGPWQHHLLVAADCRTFIHAHAGLGRVVALPGPLSWPVMRHWRYRTKD
ncbi:NlpC/P60 family protein [Altererythrobacter sp. H2]|uniref:NlpC/P60 family protein n=1 Tax=Altererythrobacter sp. H2 TaxID=3108391 RepID=UPI000BC63B3B|nr:NlpC/P60 family protein [Altererythrobacter sp. H2]OZA91045.1 MAG: hypothetical protein B7X57_10675 [Erythrobacter sp. 34-65-8]WRK96329.1 NlpC/P60 family protein [Altererythrobacter sp. H2]